MSRFLGAGFYFLPERERSNIEDQFTPVNGPAKTERAFVQINFPDDEFFSRLRLSTEGTYAALIIVGLEEKNILTRHARNEIIELDNTVRRIKAGKNFSTICAKANGACWSNTVGVDFSVDTAARGSLGGIKFKPGTLEVESAEAVRLFYYLREISRTENEIWLREFLRTFASYTTLRTVSVSYFTSISREEELKRNSKTVIPFFSITYFLAITISVISCMRFDCVRNKVWVASFGVLSAGLAVLSSFGLLLFSGVPFSMTVATAPFLILGIGVDDMFIMISCWQKTQVQDKVEKRLADTYKEAGVSITITTLTDVLAFYIGLMTPFRSVQSFCLYTGTAILFCYIYNITFFGAFLALNGRREESNRHWLTCMKVDKPKEKYSQNTDDSKTNICCVGGAFDRDTGTEEDTPMNYFFRNYYGPFLTKNWTKVFVVVLYTGYLAASIYGCFQIQEGIDLTNLAPDGSYVASYYDNEDKYFSDYGPNVMLVIKDQTFQYWNESARSGLDTCLQEFRNLSMVSENMFVSWLNSYLVYGEKHGLNLNDENVFKGHLSGFLNASGFSQDVNFTNSQIYASRLFIQTVNISTALDERNMLSAFRDTAENCAKSQNPIDMLVYHPAFIYFDQYAVIVNNTIQNLIVATTVMLIISLLLIPHPLCSLWVAFAIASVIVGVSGFMALWDVNLDSISMINLVICIGFSVDFSAHISYAFVSSKEPSANKKAIDALYHLGYPIIQGAISTIAGVVVLSAARSYIFRTFFKIMFLVILFGAVHGIMFIPVFLTFFGVCGKKITVKNESYPRAVPLRCQKSMENQSKNISEPDSC
ncbi:patched domain-containing protein 3-like [Chanos chanos]|uniref:Patched domain-containing protein 3 n=1 Tax=Chanos chanos TaxID=29144 RepID=A0A6J2UTR4_CHACN|nr:patched domain-containing protein 3-like [Chanos chanos]